MPDAGKYEVHGRCEAATIENKAHASRGYRSSSWAVMKGIQHPVMMDRERPMIDPKRKTDDGDPGKYFPTNHELAVGQERRGSVATAFWSAVPQRPIV